MDNLNNAYSYNLTCRLAFLGEGETELNFLKALSDQIPASISKVFSTSELREYRSFECDYCVLYPTGASKVIEALVAMASDNHSKPKLILLLLKLNTAKLEKDCEAKGTHLQIIRLENPDNKLQVVELLNSFFTLEKKISPPDPEWEFMGASAPVHSIHALIQSFAKWDKDPVLITGETGTGKELIARQLHKIRNIGQFSPYNAAALPVELAESLLSGHRKGSFTGAAEDKEGLIISANNGTLFIDEIGDVHPAIQVKLLRILQERKVVRLGDDVAKARDTNARFVFATNRKLKEACSDGAFREDLYHRVSSLHIEVSPLRDRKADIPLLVQHFVKEFVDNYDEKKPQIIVENVLKLDVLFGYDWPGNVRELRNIVRRAAALTGSGAIDKKLTAIVEKKIEETHRNDPQLSAAQSQKRLVELSSFFNSLLDDNRPNAKKRFAKAYEQHLLAKASGDYKEIMDFGAIRKTAASELKTKLRLVPFKADDLKNAAGLATRIKDQVEPVSKSIFDRCDQRTKKMLNEYDGKEVDSRLRDGLLKALNRELLNRELYDDKRFQKIPLSDRTQDLIKKYGVWTDLFRLNRMLIEDTYALEIIKNEAIQNDGNWGNESD